uniref:Uncharacterized protein n=1 Tax=Anguilla anguilla TaxID=7936 RepID=A0A0E9VYR4_ANGAN
MQLILCVQPTTPIPPPLFCTLSFSLSLFCGHCYEKNLYP